jgi:hypothetical protein
MGVLVALVSNHDICGGIRPRRHFTDHGRTQHGRLGPDIRWGIRGRVRIQRPEGLAVLEQHPRSGKVVSGERQRSRLPRRRC